MSISRRRHAAIVLGQLDSLAKVQRAHGELLNPGPWLVVFANILSSAPEKWESGRHGRSAPNYFGLSEATLATAARKAGLRASLDQIADQVHVTQTWRRKEGDLIGKPYYARMAPETIGRLLGVVEEVRREAKAWNIGIFGQTKEDLMEAYRERDRERAAKKRLAKNIDPRGVPLSQTKPWEALGMSRPTWYRKGKPAPALPSPEAKLAKIPVGCILH
jgi:hypothetical protein